MKKANADGLAWFREADCATNPLVAAIAMDDLESETRVLAERGRAQIVCIAFRGTYRPGSLGNPMAAAMRDRVVETLQDYQPAAVLFDLTGLDYVWGDAVCGIVLPVLRLRRSAPASCPTCLVAVGKTAQALEPLFPHSLFAVAGTKLLPCVAEGLRFLLDELERRAH